MDRRRISAAVTYSETQRGFSASFCRHSHTSLSQWLHQVRDGSGRVCHNTNAADFRHIMREHYDASTEHRGLLSAFLDILDCDIGMPVRPLAWCVRCWVHHSGDILAILLKQGVDTKWPRINFLACPAEELTKEHSAFVLVGCDQLMPNERTLFRHEPSFLTFMTHTWERVSNVPTGGILSILLRDRAGFASHQNRPRICPK